MFIRDSYQQDIIGAKRVNLKAVWLNNRSEPRALAQENPPDFAIETLSELLELPILAGEHSL
jgi:FMN phosphatase YigB (HAD superfamily)